MSVLNKKKNHPKTVSTIVVHNAPCKRTDPYADLQAFCCCEEGKRTGLGLSEIQSDLIALEKKGENTREPGLRVVHTMDLVEKGGFWVTAFHVSKKDLQAYKCDALPRRAHLTFQQGGIIRLCAAAPLWTDHLCTAKYHWRATGKKSIDEGT